MDVRAAFAVFLLFVATAKASGGVSFWRKTVTLTCPQKGHFYKAKAVKPTQGPEEKEFHEFEYNNNEKGLYYCEYEPNEDDGIKTKYYFYVQGKVCENCFELDATLFAVVIVFDMSLTGLVMAIIFKCTKKKGSTGTKQSNKAPSRSGGQGPPVPSPDYEQLNIHTRSQDTYSMVNRTG